MDQSAEKTDDRKPDDELTSARKPRSLEWLLLKGDRMLVASGFLLGLLLLISGLLAVDALAVEDSDALTRSFAALIAGNLTLVTIVIAINQLILSREFETPDKLHARIRDALTYRHEVEEISGAEVSPITPEAFLDFLVQQGRDHAVTFREAADDASDQQLQEEAEAFADTLVSQSERVSTALEEQPGGAFNTLLTILNADFTSDLHTAEQLRAIYSDSLSEPATNALDDLSELLEFIGVARQYFKMLYIHRELTGLSRKILYTGIPALVFSLLTIWIYGRQPGASLESPLLDVIVTVSAVVAFSPFAIFVAYMLRIATITRRTASLMPFKIREQSPL